MERNLIKELSDFIEESEKEESMPESVETDEFHSIAEGHSDLVKQVGALDDKFLNDRTYRAQLRVWNNEVENTLEEEQAEYLDGLDDSSLHNLLRIGEDLIKEVEGVEEGETVDAIKKFPSQVKDAFAKMWNDGDDKAIFYKPTDGDISKIKRQQDDPHLLESEDIYTFIRELSNLDEAEIEEVVASIEAYQNGNFDDTDDFFNDLTGIVDDEIAMQIVDKYGEDETSRIMELAHINESVKDHTGIISPSWSIAFSEYVMNDMPDSREEIMSLAKRFIQKNRAADEKRIIADAIEMANNWESSAPEDDIEPSMKVIQTVEGPKWVPTEEDRLMELSGIKESCSAGASSAGGVATISQNMTAVPIKRMQGYGETAQKRKKK